MGSKSSASKRAEWLPPARRWRLPGPPPGYLRLFRVCGWIWMEPVKGAVWFLGFFLAIWQKNCSYHAELSKWPKLRTPPLRALDVGTQSRTLERASPPIPRHRAPGFNRGKEGSSSNSIFTLLPNCGNLRDGFAQLPGERLQRVQK